MKNNSKKTLSVMLAAVAVTCVSLGVAFQDDGVVSATAASTTSVNAIGELEWAKTADAASYEVSSAYGTFTTSKTKAYVGEALTQAANAASGEETSVAFTITPVMSDGSKGTATEYTYTFDKLIDMGYTMHDITDYYAPAANGLNTPLKKDSRNTYTDASYKNDLLTLGLQSEKDQNGNVLGWGGHLQLFCNTIAENTYTNMLYDIQIQNHTVTLRYGDSSVVAEMVNVGNIKDTTIDGYGFEASGYAIQENVPHYISVGVFDTYALDGTKVGETVYYTCSYLSEGELIVNQSLSKFLTVEELANAGITDASYTTTSNEQHMYGATLDRANFGYWPYSDTAFNSWLFSGELPETEKVTGLYYDNADGTFNWNALDNATAYEWTDGNNAWKRVEKTSVSVSDVIAQYQAAYATTGVGDLRLRVRAIVDGVAMEEAQLKMDITQIQKTRSTKVDMADEMEWWFANKATSPTDMIFPTNSSWLDDRMLVQQTNELSANTHLTVSFQRNGVQPNGNGKTKVFSVNMFGDMYAGGVWLTVTEDGYVGLTRCWSFPNSTSTGLLTSKTCGGYLNETYWVVRKLLPAFTGGEKYYVTLGVDEVYDLSGTQTAQRYTVRFEEETEDGLNRRTVGVMTYDNAEYAKESIATPTTKNPNSSQMYLGSEANNPTTDNYYTTFGTYGGSAYFANKKYTIAYTAPDGETQLTEQVAFGEKFELPVYAAGYKITGWKKDGAAFPATGVWNLGEGVTLTTEGEPIWTADGISLTLDGKIGVNLYASVLNGVDVSGAKVKLTCKGETTEVALPAAVADGDYAGCYKISYYLPAQDMAEEITAQLVLADGTLGTAVTYSVDNYNVTEGDAEYELVTAMKAYGAAAKTFFDANAAEPILSDERVNFSAYAPTATDVNDNIKLYGVSLIVEETTTIRVYFSLESGELPAGVAATQVEDSKFYYVEKTNIGAPDLDTAYTFEIGENRVTCSALTYGLLVAADANRTNKEVALVEALYAYSQAANEYQW